MGVYDTVLVRCPQCGTPAEFQSKSGRCLLETYSLDEAPDDVLLDVNHHAPATCAKCSVCFYVEIAGQRPQRTLSTRSAVWKEHKTPKTPMGEAMTDEELADRARQLAKLYIDTNGIADLPAMCDVVEHAIANAFRIGYRSRVGEQKHEMERSLS